MRVPGRRLCTWKEVLCKKKEKENKEKKKR